MIFISSPDQNGKRRWKKSNGLRHVRQQCTSAHFRADLIVMCETQQTRHRQHLLGRAMLESDTDLFFDAFLPVCFICLEAEFGALFSLSIVHLSEILAHMEIATHSQRVSVEERRLEGDVCKVFRVCATIESVAFLLNYFK